MPTGDLSRALAWREPACASGNELHERHPELIPVWPSFCEAKARACALDWLGEQGLLEPDVTRRFTNDHPQPNLP